MKHGRVHGSHRWSLLLTLLIAACIRAPEPDGPLSVACNAPSPPDTTAILVILSDESLDAGGRILLRADSLASQEGPIFDAPSGFLVQAFATTGPGYGCASIAPVGAFVRGPGRTLERAWIHVKTDLPVVVTLRSEEGEVVKTVVATPGKAVDPITWDSRSAAGPDPNAKPGSEPGSKQDSKPTSETMS
jgi:hypothetical protein